MLRTGPLRNISIDDLTKRAGLSRSSPYFYYESKWQVPSALLSRLTADVFQASQLIFERARRPPEAAIEHAVKEVIQVWERTVTFFVKQATPPRPSRTCRRNGTRSSADSSTHRLPASSETEQPAWPPTGHRRGRWLPR